MRLMLGMADPNVVRKKTTIFFEDLKKLDPKYTYDYFIDRFQSFENDKHVIDTYFVTDKSNGFFTEEEFEALDMLLYRMADHIEYLSRSAFNNPVEYTNITEKQQEKLNKLPKIWKRVWKHNEMNTKKRFLEILDWFKRHEKD